MKNRGFIATSLIYSFFLVFLVLLAVILNSMIFNNRILNVYNKSIMNKLNKEIDKTSDEPSYVKDDLEILDIRPQTGTPNFNSVATTNEGVFIAEDNHGTSYYYRGNIDNNYMVFGHKTGDPDDGHPLYWRIVRINGDGSLRLMYEGYMDRRNLIKDSIGNVAWSTSTSSVGIHQAFNRTLNTFYTDSFLNTEYEAYISDSGFCSTIASKTNNPENCSMRDGNITCGGQAMEITDFSDYDKVATFGPTAIGASPSLKCDKANQYTVSTINGNGYLTYPIGIISSNEIVMAGGRYLQENSDKYINEDFYLYKQEDYWTSALFTKKTNSGGGGSLMSIRFLTGKITPTEPTDPSAGSTGNYVLTYSTDGSLIEKSINDAKIGVYPVINVKEEYISTIEGDGTINNPFIGKLDR